MKAAGRRSLSPHFGIPLLLCCLISVVVPVEGCAQEGALWHGARAAVCLTYDDALNVHLDRVVPALDSLGLRGTFYLSGFFPSFRARSTEWKLVAERGHELGNHTLFHPCEGKAPGREWVRPDYDLNAYTVTRLMDEITMANTLLTAIDGKTTRTFAYPCGDTTAGDSSYAEKIREIFPAARGVESKMETIPEIDLNHIGSYMIAGESADELISLVRAAMEKGALVVFLFHGVGGEHNLNVSLDDHARLLRFLKENERDVWVAPMLEIAEYIAAYRKGKR